VLIRQRQLSGSPSRPMLSMMAGQAMADSTGLKDLLEITNF